LRFFFCSSVLSLSLFGRLDSLAFRAAFCSSVWLESLNLLACRC
jgi:hypothetical protein